MTKALATQQDDSESYRVLLSQETRDENNVDAYWNPLTGDIYGVGERGEWCATTNGKSCPMAFCISAGMIPVRMVPE